MLKSFKSAERPRPDLSFLPPISPAALRRERVRDGKLDMVGVVVY